MLSGAEAGWETVVWLLDSTTKQKIQNKVWNQMAQKVYKTLKSKKRCIYLFSSESAMVILAACLPGKKLEKAPHCDRILEEKKLNPSGYWNS